MGRIGLWSEQGSSLPNRLPTRMDAPGTAMYDRYASGLAPHTVAKRSEESKRPVVQVLRTTSLRTARVIEFRLCHAL